MPDPPFDLARAHRWFAVELNNLAWGLVEAEDRAPLDAERMIHAAHASCFHWLQVGEVLNHLRAQCLLATAYSRAGLGEAAVRHAEKCLALGRDADRKMTPFDRAAAHGCAALACATAGRAEDARREYQLATSAAATLDDPSDAELFRRLYPDPE
jgi:hypothetical protein